MAEGILGLGSGQAASLNQELIDKLKEAERKARVEPLETQIEDIEGEGGESEKIAEIVAKAQEFLETIKPFDLYVSGGVNIFDQKTANVTGSSAVFDAVDEAELNVGTTNVSINQLAQRDIYQTSTFSDKTVQVTGGNDSGDMLVLSQTDRPVYQSDVTFESGGVTVDDIVDASGGTITINVDGIDKDFTVTTDMTYSELVDLIDADEDLNAELTLTGKISITHEDKETALSITESLTTPLGLSLGEKYSTEGKTYEELANLINTSVDYNASIESVGTDTYRLVIKSAESGLDNKINITQSGIDLGLNQFTSTSTISGGDPLSDGLDLTIDGVTFTTAGSQDYDSFILGIDAHSDFNASIVDGKVLISREDGTELSVTADDLSLNMTNSNNTVEAQNLQATVDGIDYDVSSNVLIVDGGLKITAIEENDPGDFSSISIQKDTTIIEPALQDFVTKYNELVELVDEELYSTESKIDDKSVLRSMLNEIKDKLFTSYGTNDDLNIFNFGIEVDQYGNMSLNTTTFNDAVENNMDDLKSLFIGLAEDEGLGTQLKEYVDSLDGFEGLLSTYESTMITRKDSLEEEKEEAIEGLDNKYALLAQQFAAYGSIITQFENQFAGLKLMIQQSSS